MSLSDTCGVKDASR